MLNSNLLFENIHAFGDIEDKQGWLKLLIEDDIAKRNGCQLTKGIGKGHLRRFIILETECDIANQAIIMLWLELVSSGFELFHIKQRR